MGLVDVDLHDLEVLRGLRLEVIAAADEHGMAMVFTGRRHFRH